MTRGTTLRLLAGTNNARGDLFNRLVGDLFFALGYDDLRFNVHKTGREIDVIGVHRLEPKRLVAECKAHAEKIGGDQVNKFRGVLTLERAKSERKKGETGVVGFFVSLSGFSESAKEQDLELGKQERLILLDGPQVIEELIHRRILIDRAEAAERAGRCAALAGLRDADLDETEVLGHELGYVWAVFYSSGKARTHFALIHADGTPLAARAAKAVIEADRGAKGLFHKLAYLGPPSSEPDRQALAKAAVERYRHWIGTECGSIQLDGLPADSDLSALRLKLERLFVPLKILFQEGFKNRKDQREASKKQEKVVGVGEYLASHPRFSLLAKPGGGKSTLLKRLAIAYALAERRLESSDELPKKNWFPLFLRCRDLRDRASRPIREILDDLPRHAGMTGAEAEAFGEQIDEALRTGRALLLIDGLDEISDEGARSAFAQNLRTFLAMFPAVAMVVTSREAGYRQIAGVIAGICEQVRLAPFDEADVLQLCESWHAEVVGGTDKVRDEARELSAKIWKNERIRALAENPLMLTTLLVVRRSIGDLPTRRVELYQEAVKVLIRTWNTEGFAPMDLDEALAQLSYVAISMMKEGIQRLGHRQLLKLLRLSREELQAELQFTRTSPEEFVERIEYRSSLLMQTGFERFDGEFQPVYEFRHLTFQEYLAARSLVEEQYPGRGESGTLVQLLEPHFEDEKWREVIPLAAVLAGRRAEPLVQRLATSCEAIELYLGYASFEEMDGIRVVLLRQCIVDEVQINPTTLRAALRQLARFGDELMIPGSISSLRNGKFGEVFQEIVEETYFGGGPGWSEYVDSAAGLLSMAMAKVRKLELDEDLAEWLLQRMEAGSRFEKAGAAWALMKFAHEASSLTIENSSSRKILTQFASRLRDRLTPLLTLEDSPVALFATLALGWLGAARLLPNPPSFEVLQALLKICEGTSEMRLRRLASWAFGEQPLLHRNAISHESWLVKEDWFEAEGPKVDPRGLAVLAWYRGGPWSDDLLAERVTDMLAGGWPTGHDLLAKLSRPGR